MGLSEVTLTLVDPELAEAAAFVLGGSADSASAGVPVAVPDSAFGATGKGFNTENTEKRGENRRRLDESNICENSATRVAACVVDAYVVNREGELL